MAFSGMSPGYPDAVCALAQGGHKKLRVHPAGTRYANHPDVGWIFHPSHPRQVGSAIAAPVAQEGNDFGFPIGHVSLLFLATGCLLLASGFLSLIFASYQCPAANSQMPAASDPVFYQTALFNANICAKI
jgi:hypothetical protein